MGPVDNNSKLLQEQRPAMLVQKIFRKFFVIFQNSLWKKNVENPKDDDDDDD